MKEPVPNQWRPAWRLGVYSTLLIVVLVLTAVMPNYFAYRMVTEQREKKRKLMQDRSEDKK